MPKMAMYLLPVNKVFCPCYWVSRAHIDKAAQGNRSHRGARQTDQRLVSQTLKNLIQRLEIPCQEASHGRQPKFSQGQLCLPSFGLGFFQVFHCLPGLPSIASPGLSARSLLPLPHPSFASLMCVFCPALLSAFSLGHPPPPRLPSLLLVPRQLVSPLSNFCSFCLDPSCQDPPEQKVHSDQPDLPICRSGSLVCCGPPKVLYKMHLRELIGDTLFVVGLVWCFIAAGVDLIQLRATIDHVVQASSGNLQVASLGQDDRHTEVPHGTALHH